jgi:hypothetical protein
MSWYVGGSTGRTFCATILVFDGVAAEIARVMLPVVKLDGRGDAVKVLFGLVELIFVRGVL